jgi:hypothetical protein
VIYNFRPISPEKKRSGDCSDFISLRGAADPQGPSLPRAPLEVWSVEGVAPDCAAQQRHGGHRLGGPRELTYEVLHGAASYRSKELLLTRFWFLNKRDLFKESAIAVEALSETTNGARWLPLPATVD